MVAQDIVLLSKEDLVKDSEGKEVKLRQGLMVYIYQMDSDDTGKPTPLIAEGIAELNDPASNGEWTKEAK